ncbi:MAG: threonylcarbamoyl-AMP synthase [Bacteroidales bacterium]|nr:threonylcarbamoyl-AMP synthase [Bacteroidales bacterium]
MNEDFDAEIARTIKVLKDGGVILYPTDTIWGIGCDATNHKAVDKVYKIKKRRENKSLIILVNGFEMLGQFVDKVPDIAGDLFDSINKPVTVIYDSARNLPKNVGATDGTIAIRIVKDEFCSRLIGEFGHPVISTSANISGEAAPLVFSKISESIKKQVDYTVQLYHNLFMQAKASTIIRLSGNGEYKIIRE